MSICDIETNLIDASREIASIHESNSRFTYGLARIIWELGKPVEELTVKELITLTKQYSETFNRLDRLATEKSGIKRRV